MEEGYGKEIGEKITKIGNLEAIISRQDEDLKLKGVKYTIMSTQKDQIEAVSLWFDFSHCTNYTAFLKLFVFLCIFLFEFQELAVIKRNLHEKDEDLKLKGVEYTNMTMEKDQIKAVSL